MKDLIIFGTTEFAELAHYYFSQGGNRKVAAFTVEGSFLEKDTLLELPVVAFEDIESRYPAGEYDMFIAIGYTDMNRLRESKCRDALEKGYSLASYVSDKAVVHPDFPHGHNCFILEHTIVQPFATLGDNVVLMNKNLVSHHCVIGDNCFVSANVTICGSVTVGNNCFFGAGACIRDGITVAPYSLIGACAYIAKDTREGGVYISESTKRCKQASNGMQI